MLKEENLKTLLDIICGIGYKLPSSPTPKRRFQNSCLFLEKEKLTKKKKKKETKWKNPEKVEPLLKREREHFHSSRRNCGESEMTHNPNKRKWKNPRRKTTKR